jgi:aryl-alcohol dehydrogenase-like predicted oxidoreductase
MNPIVVARRQLGSRNARISELGFGAGGFWGMEMFSERLARDLVDIAIDSGVNFFDTGPNYSGGNAEGRLGKILAARRPNIFVGTKCGTHLIGRRHVKDYSYPALRRSLDESLRRLQTTHVDLLQLHGMPKRLEDETMQFLCDAKRCGDVGLLGVSTDIAGAEKALAAEIFDCVMIEYNVIRRHAQQDLIERCARSGLGVMVKSPLAQTLYSDEIFKVSKVSDVWYLLRAIKNHRSKFFEGRKYRFLSRFDGMNCHDLALQFVLSNHHVSCAIIGTTSQSHLINNLNASMSRLPECVRQRIEQVS